MASSEKQWKTMARSQFPWEQEALDFIHERFPGQDNYRAWANFEFIADDGSINEEKLGFAARNGSFLTLSVPQGAEEQACIELQRRFDIDIRDLDRLFIDLMKREAGTAGADWNVVLKADAAMTHDSADWQNLQILVECGLPDITKHLRSPDRTPLIVHPGLLARYDQMHLLSGIIADTGRGNGIHGLWLLVPANDTSPLPVINQKAIPSPIPPNTFVSTAPGWRISIGRKLLHFDFRRLR
jgi:hypothetical protein